MTPAPFDDARLDRVLGAYDAPAPSAGFAARVAAEAVRRGRVQPAAPPPRRGAGRRPWVRRRMVAGLVFLNLLAASALAAAIGGHPFEFGRLAALTHALIAPHRAVDVSPAPGAARNVRPAPEPRPAAPTGPPAAEPIPFEAARAPAPSPSHLLLARPIVAPARAARTQRHLAVAPLRPDGPRRSSLARAHASQFARHESPRHPAQRLALGREPLGRRSLLAGTLPSGQARSDLPRADLQRAEPPRPDPPRTESASAGAFQRPADALAASDQPSPQSRRDEMRQRRAQWRAARFANPDGAARAANPDRPGAGQGQRWRNGWRRAAGRLGRRGA